MPDRLTPEQIAELERFEPAATPGPWRLRHRYCGWSSRAPEPGLDTCCGLGWDWDWDAPDTNTPPEPGRGIFALGADAGLVMALRNAAPALIAAARENERLRADNTRLRGRLEIDHAFKSYQDKDGNWTTERIDIPLEKQDRFPDGITCRDATIKLQDERIDELLDENDRLREALRPFAEWADWLDQLRDRGLLPHPDSHTVGGSARNRVTMEDLRRARAALGDAA